MLAKKYPETKKVVGTLKKMSLGKQLRMILEEREVHRKDIQAITYYAEEKAREKGRDEERARAYREKLDTARSLKAERVSLEVIAHSLKLPIEEIEGL
ncbi:MAG: hypothetical protein LBQ38_09930 [Spirochaetaceae bacterium]|jgi:predicted transposase/invertase (TIGR01784 family)|nr:hypothetical protein [Spirochaetaceae bacterium]